MILRALARYYERISAEENAVPVGYSRQTIDFCIDIDESGNALSLRDLRSKNRGKELLIPKPVNRSGNILPNLLWDTIHYIYGTDFDKILAFKNRIIRDLPEALDDVGVKAVLRFLEHSDLSQCDQKNLESAIEKNSKVVFHFSRDPEDQLVFDRVLVRMAIQNLEMSSFNVCPDATCLITGMPCQAVRCHDKIKGVRGAQSSGANIVSFDKAAYRSYDKEQGSNAPIGRQAHNNYTSALNHLLKNEKNRFSFKGDRGSTILFWAESALCDDPLPELFDNQWAKDLFQAPFHGVNPTEAEKSTRYYVLSLIPNSSRLAIGFWHDGSVASVRNHILQHFKDCDIPGLRLRPSIPRLLYSITTEKEGLGVAEAAFVKAVFSGSQYPYMVFLQAVQTISRKMHSEESIAMPVALIQGFFRRQARVQGKEETYMDEQTKQAYDLGRAFRLLCKIQEKANGKETLRARYYGAASKTPALVFPMLIHLMQHHFKKFDTEGARVYWEAQVSQLLGSGTSYVFPPYFSLEAQGAFALGFYFENQKIYTKNNNDQESI